MFRGFFLSIEMAFTSIEKAFDVLEHSRTRRYSVDLKLIYIKSTNRSKYLEMSLCNVVGNEAKIADALKIVAEDLLRCVWQELFALMCALPCHRRCACRELMKTLKKSRSV